MKANLSGLGGIKTLLLVHGEKVGMAVVAALALLLVYKALIGREYLAANRQAASLKQEIDSARAGVMSAKWDQAPPEVVRQAVTLGQSGDRMIDGRDYLSELWRIGWNAPLVPPTVRRTDPLLLEAQDVEAYGGSGLLAFTNEEVRIERVLEERAREDRRVQRQESERERFDVEATPGGRGRGRGAADDRFGQEMVDPENPNRRPLMGAVGSTGFASQEGDEIVTAYWAAVVAKVPIKDQIRAYKDAFENARGYAEAADFPTYLGYYVERAEVRRGQELQWSRVQVTNGKGERISAFVSSEVIYGQPSTTGTVGKKGVTTDWATIFPEIVDPRYLDPAGVLVFPLPPLVGRSWGYDLVASHSEIPLASEATELEEEQPATEPDAPAEEEEDGDEFRGAAPDVNQGFAGLGGRGGFGRGGYPGMMRGGEMDMGGRGYPYAGRGGEYDMEGGYARGGYPTSAGRGGMMGAAMMPQVSDWLLRFLDFTVQPGKKYKYRVRLVLLDPNQNAAGRPDFNNTLDESVSDRIRKEKAARRTPTPIPYRVTEWSEPSRTVSIPLAGTVRVASADPASEKSFTSEPDVTLLVESFGTDDKRQPIQAALESDFGRGYVANMTKDVEVAVEGGRFADKMKGFKFRTGITVVDIRGGERLSRDVETEARVLLMDPAGQLFVQQESDDAEAVERHRAIFEEPDEDDPGYRGGYPGRGYPGRGGMEMMEFGR